MILACAVCGVLAGLTASGALAAHSRMRACGSARLMAPNQVWATKTVSCRQARQLMRELLGGSPQCYPAGFTDRPMCSLEGFMCSASPAAGHVSRGSCADRRRRIRGTAVA
jgi:hypothetical protein